jgi:tetratricopeptide (TPR) repeat protein
MRLKLDLDENNKLGLVRDAYFEAYKESDKALKKNDYDLALDILYKAIKTNEQLDGEPFDRADFYVKCAQIYRMKKEGNLELAAITKAIQLRGFDWDYQKRAQCYEERGDYDNAIADYTKAIEQGGYQPESWQWRGEIFLKKNDYDSAIADFLMAIENCKGGKRYKNLCKGCCEVYSLCGQAYLKKGDARTATKYLNKAKRLKRAILAKKEV